jgi:aspartate racemase
MSDKIVGILGGMGPEATIDLFAKIVKATAAKNDEDHLRIIIDNNPKMPSRLDAILKGGPSPVPAMVATAKNIERAGADFIIIAANTAHWFHGDVQKAVKIPVLNMIEETVNWIQRCLPEVKTIGVLATTGTIQTGMYHDAFKKSGVKVIAPTDQDQEKVMASIMGFKYGEPVSVMQGKMVQVAEFLLEAGAEGLVMGCTEVPIILEGYVSSVPLIDPNQIVAEVVVKLAKSDGTEPS